MTEPSDRLTPDPVVIEGRRVLGVVPGKPVAGVRKDPADDDMVMVWPHLLVRHAVAAMAVLLVVLLLGVFVDAPLRDVAEPDAHTEPRESALVLRCSPGAVGSLPSAGGRRVDTDGDHRGAVRAALHRSKPLHQAAAPSGCGRDVHDVPGDLRGSHDHRVRLPRTELGLGVAVAGMARRAVTGRDVVRRDVNRRDGSQSEQEIDRE